MNFLNAKLFLIQAYRLNELIISNEEELAKLNELSTGIPGTDYSKDRVQTTPSGDASYTKIIERIVELERVIKNDIESFLKLKLEIRNTIDSVCDNDEKLLLRQRYLNFSSWEDICQMMHVSSRTVHRIHAKALDSVDEILLQNYIS